MSREPAVRTDVVEHDGRRIVCSVVKTNFVSTSPRTAYHVDTYMALLGETLYIMESDTAHWCISETANEYNSDGRKVFSLLQVRASQ